jgi:hypothetical protein
MRQARSLAHFMALVLLACVLITAGCTYSPYNPPPLAFSGDSAAAKETVVVPTLNTPAPKSRNVIWCATFQMCWDELKPLVGPIDVPGAQDIIRRLDGAHINAADMPKDRYYAVAGCVMDGIVAKIQSEMAAKFPQVKPNLPPMGNHLELLAYAYLNDAVKFRTAYFDRHRGDDFTDSAGNKTHVSSFGLYDKSREADVNAELGCQIEILYSGKEKYPPREFVLDLDKKSDPTQLILACVEPKETLAATWQDVQSKIANWKPAKEDERKFGGHDSLAVPNINYKIQHSFKELETSGPLKTFQAIEFRLDRSGAAIVGEAYFACPGCGEAMGRHFSFTRPFLIAMRKRGSTEPYFVMWVENAELLCK